MVGRLIASPDGNKQEENHGRCFISYGSFIQPIHSTHNINNSDSTVVPLIVVLMFRNCYHVHDLDLFWLTSSHSDPPMHQGRKSIIQRFVLFASSGCNPIANQPLGNSNVCLAVAVRYTQFYLLLILRSFLRRLRSKDNSNHTLHTVTTAVLVPL